MHEINDRKAGPLSTDTDVVDLRMERHTNALYGKAAAAQLRDRRRCAGRELAVGSTLLL